MMAALNENELLKLKPVTPDFTYGPFSIMPISRVWKQQIQLSMLNGKSAKVSVGGEGEEKALVVANITTENPLTTVQVEIQMALGELIKANGNRAIHVTYAQIWRAFACLEDGAKVPKKTQEMVRDIILPLTKIDGRIDFSQQLEKHKSIKKDGRDNYNKGVLEGKLVLADRAELSAGGYKTEGLVIYRPPLFYLHSQLTNQVVSIDRAMLDTTAKRIVDAHGKKRSVDTKNNDLVFILLKRHLAREIEQMKREKKRDKDGKYEPRRNFDAIIEALGDIFPVKDEKNPEVVHITNKPTPKQRRTLREDIDLLCSRWKIQGYIKDFGSYWNKGSKAIAGVKIEV